MSKIKLPHASGNSMSIAAPATNPASDLELKLPATIGTAGQYLTVDGSGNLVWADPPGITSVDMWRMPSNATGAVNPITNWERVDTTTNSFSQGFIGTGMSESSGVFTFPSTGIWYLDFHCVGSTDDAERYFQSAISLSGDTGSNWLNMAWGYSNHFDASNTTYGNAIATTTVDVTNTSTQRVRFMAEWAGSTSGDSTLGTTNGNFTTVLFLRLGAT